MKKFLWINSLRNFIKTVVSKTLTNDVNAELSEEKDGFFITYNITEGPQFSIGKVNLISKVQELNSVNFFLVTLKKVKFILPGMFSLTFQNWKKICKQRALNLFVQGQNLRATCLT